MFRTTLLALTLPLTAWAGPNDFEPAALRIQGPDGLSTVLDAWRAEGSPDNNEWHILADTVAQQRDALTSGLYWYTDLEQAKAASEDADKPILSLRLLGDLTQEYSCANSRFFRTVLYSDPEIAAWLSETFVLHWSSERPAPLLTIDYGDGRVVQRTITGNSAHYVLDETGRPLDVLPGLVAPHSFQETLTASAALWSSMQQAKPDDADALLYTYHQDGVTQAAERLSNDLSRARGETVNADMLREWLAAVSAPNGSVHALEAMDLAIAKFVVEQPILTQFMGRDVRRVRERGFNPVDETHTNLLPSDEEWAALGDARRGDVFLSSGAIQRIRDENPHLDGDVRELVASFTRSIARDTIINERLLRPRIQARFTDGMNVFEADRVNTASFEDLNDWVYASVFLAPRQDAWLGMVNNAVYTGLDNGGVRSEASEHEGLASN
ncbi:MAG: hypothetical protein ACI855_004304 [Myxococcota bacterium]|jgi:hypothetical protein